MRQPPNQLEPRTGIEPRTNIEPRTEIQPRIGIVLGSGGILGGSFHAGVLLALEDLWGIDPRNVDAIVGTSTGAVTAGLVTAGLSAEDLYAREVGGEPSDEGRALLARAGRSRSTSDRFGLVSGMPADPTVAFRAVVGSRPVSAGAVVAGLIPRGIRSSHRLRRYFDDLHRSSWPTTPRLRLCAVDLHSGRRVVLDDSGPATPGLAIAASCAMPGVSRPVRVGHRELVDGVAHSPDNTDTMFEGFDLVIVSSPMSADRTLWWSSPMAVVRNGIRASGQADRRRMGRDGGFVVVLPTPADVKAMGPDLFDRRRRAVVARRAYETTIAALASQPKELQTESVAPALT